MNEGVMIRTDNEYRKAVNRLKEERMILDAQKTHFIELGHSDQELERLMQPLLSFHDQLEEEVIVYEQMKRGDLGVLRDLSNIGRWLIGIRIARGLSQKELAEKLGVSSAQVSRDETNEYHGITLAKAQSILERLGVKFVAEIEDSTNLTSPDHYNNDLQYA